MSALWILIPGPFVGYLVVDSVRKIFSDDDRLMDIAGRCIDAGMHIHLDKPGGESFSKFKQVLDEAGRRNLTVQLGYMYRNNPAVQFCRNAV